ncbi:MAG TPA: universal stress protein [Burkholderiales bacterium]|nr:universal stress protein [Burkholderiales bacterium]
MRADRILLASHGTTGALAADQAAVALCRQPGTALFHLTVVPDLWLGMMGDDWLNNVATRDAYCKHIEAQLNQDIDRHRRIIEPQVAAQGASYRSQVAVGEPTDCLLGFAAAIKPDLIVLGSRRPRGVPGLQSRIRVEKLIDRLSISLLIVPYPAPLS